MMAHSSSAYTHDKFMMIMQKVSNMELYYRAISSKVDHARVVQQVRKAGHLSLILPFLKSSQQHNSTAVNEAINEMYLESEQHEELRQSIEDFDNFDQIALAQKLEKHELVEMRRIAALVYKKNKRFKQSIELSKLDGMYRDAMETARDSGNEDAAEVLLRGFVESGSKECFAACLYTCYDLVRPDVALELAWRNGMVDFCMPYLIQVLREYTGRIDALDRKTLKKEEEEEKQKSAPNDYVPDFMMPNMPGMMGPGGMGMLAIAGPGAAPPPQPGFGGPAPGMGAPGMMPSPTMMAPGMPQMMSPGGF